MSSTASEGLVARLLAALLHPKLPRRLALLAFMLTLPSVAIGFHLDDHVHRYMLSSRPGAAELLRVYESPFGIANGERADNRWQMEHGYAPWWTHPDLLVSLWRPLSELSHRVDAALFPDTAPLQHLVSSALFALLVLSVTHLYRALLGVTTASGLAALMYALDHAHGFAVGWIANRNAVITAAFGAVALLVYVRARAASSTAKTLLSAALFGCALLSGESSVAVLAYVLGHAAFVERSPLRSRALAVMPHLVVLVAWRVAYVAMGRGARHSGLYLDPLAEPSAFARATLERLPALVLGQLGLPPAEAIVFAPEALRLPLWLFALAFCALLAFVLLPVLRRDPHARMLALGALASLVLACSTHPHNRLLFYGGLGVMPLLSLAWHALMQPATTGVPVAPLARTLVAALVGFRLFVSPLLLPLAACSIALTAPAEVGARSILRAGARREVVLVSSPDAFHMKLVPVLAALESQPPPAQLLALSFGEQPLTLRRLDAHTLELDYGGAGLLASPLLELYRARAEPLPVGARVVLDSVEVHVVAHGPQGTIARARFRFRRALDAAQLSFLAWDGTGYAPVALPEVGSSLQVAGAALRFGL